MFTGYDLQYGGMDTMVLAIVNAIKMKMIDLDPAEGTITDLGTTSISCYGQTMDFDLGKARWKKRGSDGAILDCYTVNGIPTAFTLILNPSGFKLLDTDIREPDGSQLRYITCSYDSSTKAYSCYTHDTDTSGGETDNQMFIGEPQSGGNFRFCTRQWNEGTTEPVFYGVGYATSSIGGFIAFRDSDADGNIESGDGFREEYYDGSGDSLYYATMASSGGAMWNYFGRTIPNVRSFYRLKHMIPAAGYSISVSGSDYSLDLEGGASVLLPIADPTEFPAFGTFVSTGARDEYGIIASTTVSSAPPYLDLDDPSVPASTSLAPRLDVSAFRQMIRGLETEWVDELDLASYRAVLEEIPPLANYADLE